MKKYIWLLMILFAAGCAAIEKIPDDPEDKNGKLFYENGDSKVAASGDKGVYFGQKF